MDQTDGKNGNNRGFTLINRLFGINQRQWTRVRAAWLINFFFRVGFVIGWSTLTGMFVTRFGIEKMPFLFIANGVFIIIGTLFYADIVAKVKREWLIIITAITAGVFLFGGALFANKNNILFFTFLLFAESVLLTQLNILIGLLREESFSPLESEHAFPVIESSETIGSIIGGTIIAFGTELMPVYKFIFIWIIALMLIIPVVIHATSTMPKIPYLAEKKRRAIGDTNILQRLEQAICHVRTIPFLKSLFLIVLLQWIFVNILEFQYTKAVQQVVSHTAEDTLAFHEYGRIFHISLLTDPEGITSSEENVAPYEQSIAEGALVQRLGSLHILFGFLTLLIQLFFAGRLLQSLGIIGSLLLYPAIMLLSLTGLFFKFGFISALVTKANFEIGNVIHKNAYHSSYYALKHNVREQAREFLEGFVRPVGGIAGMTIILLIEMAFTGKALTLWITSSMFVIMSVVLLVTLKLQNKYTTLSKQMLLADANDMERWDAIEILGQKGHKRATAILLNTYAKYTDEPFLRGKILRTLGLRKDFGALPIIIDAFQDADSEVRLAAVETLQNFSDLGQKFYTQSFSRYRVIHELKELFWKETIPDIRAEIIRTFAILKEPDTAPFLLTVIKHADPSLQARCIEACGSFQDPNVAHFIQPYLDSPHCEVKANTMIVLWPYTQYRPVIKERVLAMAASQNPICLENVYRFIGAVRYKKARPYLLEGLRHTSLPVRFHAALALEQCGDRDAFSAMLACLYECDLEMVRQFKKVLRGMTPSVANRIRQMVSQLLAERIRDILERHRTADLHSLSEKTLNELKKMYEVLDHKREVYEIQKILHTRAIAPIPAV